MNYEFRRLNSTDLFPLANIISKVGLDKIAEVIDLPQLMSVMQKAKQSNGDVSSQQYIAGINLSLKIAQKVFEGLPRCEKEVYQELASVSGLSIKEIRELGMDEFFEMIINFIQKEEFKDFFKVASKLFGQ